MFDLSHLHPMIVHFPIALLIVGLFSDLTGVITKKNFFSNSGFYLLILGYIGLIAAFLSGNLAGEGVAETGTLKQALEMHEAAAELSVWIMSAAAAIRIAVVLMKKYSGVYKWIAVTLFLIGAASVARTGYYGGELVYKHAAGVTINLGFDFMPENSDSEISTPLPDESANSESENDKDDD